ncbi:MAG: DHHA1 domain-containing protein, partial [Candidatus Puniceispirillales bacterium]
DKVKYIANFLKTNPSQIIKKIEQLVFDNKNTTNELIALKKKVISSEENLSNKVNLNGVSFEYKIYEDLSIKDLKPTAESLLKKNQSEIVCLISKIDNKASLVIAVDKMIISKFNAVDMVNFISKILGGKGGGGRPDMAQSGGSLPDNSELAIQKLKDYINNTV